jgi:hypothetical protein
VPIDLLRQQFTLSVRAAEYFCDFLRNLHENFCRRDLEFSDYGPRMN